MAELAKGLPRPKKVKKPDFDRQVLQALEDEVRVGGDFAYPSAKKGEMRYWSRDEHHLLREKAVEKARTPLPLSALTKELASEIKGVDSSFVETVVRVGA